MNIHAVYLPGQKVFKVYKSSDSVHLVKLKCKEHGCVYVGSRIKSNMNLNSLSCYKTNKKSFYYANDYSCSDIARVVNVEYEDVWNILHNVYQLPMVKYNHR